MMNGFMNSRFANQDSRNRDSQANTKLGNFGPNPTTLRFLKVNCELTKLFQLRIAVVVVVVVVVGVVVYQVYLPVAYVGYCYSTSTVMIIHVSKDIILLVYYMIGKRRCAMEWKQCNRIKLRTMLLL